MSGGRLAGRRAIVTGASRGLGAAIALELAAAGASVGLAVRDVGRGEGVAAAVRRQGRQSEVASCDAADPVSVAAAVRVLTLGLKGDANFLVNNAAVITPVGPAAELDIEEWGRAIQVNLVSVMAASQAVLAGMRRLGGGTIVNISSGAASLPGMPFGSAYSVSKAALETLTEHMDAELKPSGVAVRAVRPGRVDTGMQEQLRDTALVGETLAARHRAWLADGELLDPGLPARLVCAICAEPSQYGSVTSVYDDRARELLWSPGATAAGSA